MRKATILLFTVACGSEVDLRNPEHPGDTPDPDGEAAPVLRPELEPPTEPCVLTLEDLAIEEVDGEHVVGVALGATPDGAIHVVYGESPVDLRYAHRFEDGWTVSPDLPGGEAGEAPAAAVTADALHVIYYRATHSGSTGPGVLRHVRGDGEAFEPRTTLDDTEWAQSGLFNDIAIDAAGVHVVYARVFTDELMYVGAPDGEPELVRSGAGRLSLVADHGSLDVAMSMGTELVHLARSDSWREEVVLQADDDLRRPAIARGPSGELHVVVAVDAAGGDRLMHAVRRGDAPWETTEIQRASAPDIAVDANGTLHLTAHGIDGGLLYGQHTGQGWSFATVHRFEGPGMSALAVRDGVVHVAYGAGPLHYARFRPVCSVE